MSRRGGGGTRRGRCSDRWGARRVRTGIQCWLTVKHVAAAEPGRSVIRDRWLSERDEAARVPHAMSVSPKCACTGMIRRSDDRDVFFRLEEPVQDTEPVGVGERIVRGEPGNQADCFTGAVVVSEVTGEVREEGECFCEERVAAGERVVLELFWAGEEGWGIVGRIEEASRRISETSECFFAELAGKSKPCEVSIGLVERERCKDECSKVFEENARFRWRFVGYVAQRTVGAIVGEERCHVTVSNARVPRVEVSPRFRKGNDSESVP